jgi:NAD(P) transhydrogenase subunit beta
MEFDVLTICYLIGSVTFILGLKMLSNPARARRGNLIAAFGMSMAILGTIFLYRDDNGNRLHNYGWIFGGILIGGTIGTLAAKKVKMTAMPEMVSMFNGMGGACAALISVVEFNRLIKDLSFTMNPRLSDLRLVSLETYLSKGELLIILIGLVIGSISFAGSMIAWGKLNGTIKDYSFKGQHLLNLLFLFLILVGIVYLMIDISKGFVLVGGVHITTLAWVKSIFYGVFAFALLYGVLFVMPIGGADMPVVISILNSFTGVACSLAEVFCITTKSCLRAVFLSVQPVRYLLS